jgi:hypothetical protein
MERRRLMATCCGVVCEIEEDKPEVGAYLYAFMSDGTQYDYLQNSIMDCQEFALEEFSIPLSCWQAAASVFLVEPN